MLGSVIWIAPAVFATISHIAERRLGGEPMPSLRELLFSGGDWLIYAFLAPLIFWVVNRWPIVRPVVGRRMIVHFLFAVLSCLLWATGGKVLLERYVVAAAETLPLTLLGVMVNDQAFTKTANCWGVSNNRHGTNSNRIVVLRRD